MELAQNSALKQISKIRHLKDSLRSETLNKISEEISILVEDIDVKNLEPKIYVNLRGTWMSQVGPHTTTKRNQDSPYNHFVIVESLVSLMFCVNKLISARWQHVMGITNTR